MSTPSTPQTQGWCPGALRPMLSGDGLVVRVRPFAGQLSPAQALGIAALAERHGNGLLDLTQRANLQLRGVAPADHPAVLDGLRSLGLLDASPQAEARRNILVNPFWTPDDGTLHLAAALADALADADAPTLPGKFGFAVDCVAQTVLHTSSADIRLERAPQGILVRADGYPTGAVVDLNEAIPTAMELARWFLAHGSRRMAALATPTAYQPLPPRFQTPANAAPAAAPQPGPVAHGWLVGFEFGQIQASTLAALAARGALRMTPWQMLLLEGCAHAPDGGGLITQPFDPRLRVIACTGAPGCLQAAAATRPLARTLAALVPPGSLLHVSGCSKGCAHPQAAPTLVATPAGFDLIRFGVASTPPDLRALSPETIASYLPPIFHAS